MNVWLDRKYALEQLCTKSPIVQETQPIFTVPRAKRPDATLNVRVISRSPYEM